MRNLLTIAALALAFQLSAQSADQKVKELYAKYGDIPAFKANVTYTTANDNMGFSNTQKGSIVVEGQRYIMKFGTTETWLNNGQTEYVGTKEEDHSQILYFCPGQNQEAMVNFLELLTFYGSGHNAQLSGDVLELTPTGEAAYTKAMVTFSGDNIQSVKFADDFGTTFEYSLSGFSTNTSGTQFVINENEYREKIDERRGCK